MENTDTQAQPNEQANIELIKSILVGMAVETNVATLQGMNPTKVYKAIDTSARENTQFFMRALKRERADGLKEGITLGRKGRLTHARVRFLIDAYKASHKDEKLNIDAVKFIEWVEKGENYAEKKTDKLGVESIACPFCGEDGFNKVGLKNHLEYKCRAFMNQSEVENS